MASMQEKNCKRERKKSSVIPKDQTYLTALGQKNLQRTIYPSSRQVKMRLVRRNRNPHRARPRQVRQFTNRFLQHFALQDGTKHLGAAAEGGGKRREIERVLSFFQSVDVAGGQDSLFF